MRTIKALLIFAMIITASISFAQTYDFIPLGISYQGRITDSEGQPAEDGTHPMRFYLYDSDEDGTLLWRQPGDGEPAQQVETDSGYFTVVLGTSDYDVFSEVINENPSDRWLQIEVAGEFLNPRVRLLSQPFSYRSVVADTAKNSLDKTIDASELTQGILNTERYSAYNDLVAEGNIGSASDQVAAGNHSHFIQGMTFIEDTTDVDTYIPENSDWITAKILTIPPNTLGNFWRLLLSTNGQVANVRVFINDQELNMPFLTGARLSQIDFVRYGWDHYLTNMMDFTSGVNQYIMADRTLPITIRVAFKNDSPSGTVAACSGLVVYTGRQ